MTKRTQNTQGLKVKFLAPTNKRDARIKLTQTNNNKSKIFDFDYRLELLDFVYNFLDAQKEVKSYCLVVDNTYFLLKQKTKVLSNYFN